MSCPFVEPYDKSIDAIPLGTTRIYVDYFFTNGFYFNRKNNIWDKPAYWKSSADIWEIDGRQVNTLVGDRLWFSGTEINANHVGTEGGYSHVYRDVNLGSFTVSKHVKSTVIDSRDNLTANYASIDGSAATYKGNSEDLFDAQVPNSSTRSYRMPFVR
ncbi:hypothetical protein [Poriferisphaera sp. WC338]|uniref:hypothetical protein n=1 Tax=Poriferisphaera sp. WC338 TaxID=3425129 RepID=UPI003D812D82